MERATKILVMATLASVIIFLMAATLAVLVVTDLVTTMREEIENEISELETPTSGAPEIPVLEEINAPGAPTFPTGRLPVFISEWDVLHSRNIGPDDFDQPAKTYKQNFLQAKQGRGANRILISNRIVGTRDAANPGLTWKAWNRILEQSEDDLGGVEKVSYGYG